MIYLSHIRRHFEATTRESCFSAYAPSRNHADQLLRTKVDSFLEKVTNPLKGRVCVTCLLPKSARSEGLIPGTSLSGTLMSLYQGGIATDLNNVVLLFPQGLLQSE